MKERNNGYILCEEDYIYILKKLPLTTTELFISSWYEENLETCRKHDSKILSPTKISAFANTL